MNVISENRKNKTLNLRIRQEDRDLIDRVAKGFANLCCKLSTLV